MTNLEHAARIVLTALEKADIATDSLIWWDERELLRHALEPSVSSAQALDLEAIKALVKKFKAINWMDEEYAGVKRIEAQYRSIDPEVWLILIAEIERLRAPSRATPALTPIESQLAEAEALLLATNQRLERLHNLFDNYGIPRWPLDAVKARLQRMYRAWSVPGADESLVPFTHEQWADTASRATPEEPLDEKTERRLREFLWLRHGHQGQYGDDGEMQCGKCAPMWDYRRTPLAEIVAQAIKAADETKIAALLSASRATSAPQEGQP